jgi:hypothetical protein
MSKSPKNASQPVTGFVQDEIQKAFRQFPNRNFNYKQLSKHIKPAFFAFMSSMPGASDDPAVLNKELKKEIAIILERLREKEELIEVSRGSFKLKPSHSYQEGYIDFTSSGAAYLLSESGEDDIYIAPRNVKMRLTATVSASTSMPDIATRNWKAKSLKCWNAPVLNSQAPYSFPGSLLSLCLTATKCLSTSSSPATSCIMPSRDRR